MRSTGSNIVDVEHAVDKKISVLESSLPGIKFTKIRSNGKYVEEAYHASFESLVLGALLAVIAVSYTHLSVGASGFISSEGAIGSRTCSSSSK